MKPLILAIFILIAVQNGRADSSWELKATDIASMGVLRGDAVAKIFEIRGVASGDDKILFKEGDTAQVSCSKSRKICLFLALPIGFSASPDDFQITDEQLTETLGSAEGIQGGLNVEKIDKNKVALKLTLDAKYTQDLQKSTAQELQTQLSDIFSTNTIEVEKP